MRGETIDGYRFHVWSILWDTDGEDDADLPDDLVVDVPEEIYAADEEEDFISNWLSDEYGHCHRGFLYGLL